MSNWSLAIRNDSLNLLRIPKLHDGYIRMYTGPRPATPETPITTQELVSTHRFSNPSFPDATTGTSTANPITSAPCVKNPSATIEWGRSFESDGVTPVRDFSVGTVGTDVILANNTVTFGTLVVINSLVMAEPL